LPETGPKSERNSLVVITDDPEILPELRKYLGGSFQIALATTEGEIKSALQKTELHAILFNLDAIGEAPRDGLEVIEEIRKIRNDVVLAVFTRST
jgi:DNA-binding response OmpR family regulator